MYPGLAAFDPRNHWPALMASYGAAELYSSSSTSVDPGELTPIMKGEDFDRMRAKYKDATAGIKDILPSRCAQVLN